MNHRLHIGYQNRCEALHEPLCSIVRGYDSVTLRSDVEPGRQEPIFNLNVGRQRTARYGLVPQIVMTVGLLVGVAGVERMSESKANAIGMTEPPRDMFVGEKFWLRIVVG